MLRRSLALPVFLTAVAALLTAPASAAPVSRTVDLRLRIQIPGLQTTPDTGGVIFDVTRSGRTISVDEAAQSLALAAGAFGLTTPFSTPLATTFAITKVTAATVSNASGTFALPFNLAGVPAIEKACPVVPSDGPFGGAACVPQTGFGGVLPLVGSLNLVGAGGAFLVPFPLDNRNWGVGGVGNFNGTTGTFATFTAEAAPWTLGTASVARTTASGGTVTTTAQGTVNAGAGQITLVTPMFSQLAPGGTAPSFGFLTITFTDGGGVPAFLPEPGTLGLLLSGLAGLAWVRRRR